MAQHFRRSLILALPSILVPGFASAQSTTRVSLGPGGVQSINVSSGAAISADGRFVAFHTLGTNFFPGGDGNGSWDVFVRDRLTSTTELISIALGGSTGLSGSSTPAISADGRFVSFTSGAPDLVAGDTTSSFFDLFVRDRLLGSTELVSLSTGGTQGNASSVRSALSGAGRWVAFDSDASNLVAGDANGARDVFVRDRLLGTTERVSLTNVGGEANGASQAPAISDDGRYVAFESSASNLVAGDSNGVADVFVRDRLLGTTVRVSLDAGGVQGNLDSKEPSISADGRFVAFESWASNLVAGDTNNMPDVFVRDLIAPATERVSVSSAGVQCNFSSQWGRISGDGLSVAFRSLGWNLVADDDNGWEDVFVRDRIQGTTERVSVSSAGVQGNAPCRYPSISASGRWIAFEGTASNIAAGDSNGVGDVFLRDRGDAPPVAFCFGDGSSAVCPCANNGVTGAGCENSAMTGGAVLSSVGVASLAYDTLVLTSDGELPSALSIFLQGNATIAPLSFGDGLRCAGGVLKRLYALSAVHGSASAPQPGDLAVSARSAALGDPLGLGSIRHYQTYYRDPQLGFCPAPQGDSWNISSGLSITWIP